MAEIKKFTIGIDPGVTTGIAVYNRELKKIVNIKTTDFWGCLDYIRRATTPGNALIMIEAPNKTAMYARQEDKVKGARYGNRMQSNAASNAREAELLADGLEKEGFEVRRVKPTRRNFEKAGDDVRHIQKTTGFMEKTNAHTRDAIMLCYGI